MAFAAAHRGLSSQHAENTVAAFQAAIDAGFRCLELDLRSTADGEVVVLHDAGIDRTTDGNGRVADMKYDELRTYETGEGPVPRLDDLLAHLKGWDGHWNVEIKAWRAAAASLDILDHHNVLERSQVSSMDPRALRTVLERKPGAVRGLIVLGPPDLEDLEMAKELGCRWLNADHDFLTDATIEEMRRHGFRIGAWTVNDPDTAQALEAKGVECIITDEASVLKAVPGTPAF